MKAAVFDYIRADNLDNALAALSQARGTAKLLAGGQSLGPMLNLRLARPRLLVDIARLQALRQIEDLGSAWRIGAAVTHSAIEDARDRLRGGEMLSQVAGTIAYRAVRNRGTIGGSLAHADPAADWPLALAALGASIAIKSTGASRRVRADQFVLAAFTTTLAADEIIEAIEVPKLSQAARSGYYKFCRKTGDFPEVNAAAVFDPERRTARVFLGAMGRAPIALHDLAQSVAQQGEPVAGKDAVLAAIARAAPALDPIERRMAAAAVQRALQQVFRT